MTILTLVSSIHVDFVPIICSGQTTAPCARPMAVAPKQNGETKPESQATYPHELSGSEIFSEYLQLA